MSVTGAIAHGCIIAERTDVLTGGRQGNRPLNRRVRSIPASAGPAKLGHRQGARPNWSPRHVWVVASNPGTPASGLRSKSCPTTRGRSVRSAGLDAVPRAPRQRRSPGARRERPGAPRRRVAEGQQRGHDIDSPPVRRRQRHRLQLRPPPLLLQFQNDAGRQLLAHAGHRGQEGQVVRRIASCRSPTGRRSDDSEGHFRTTPVTVSSKPEEAQLLRRSGSQ